jgi:hypothetical protein
MQSMALQRFFAQTSPLSVAAFREGGDGEAMPDDGLSITASS